MKRIEPDVDRTMWLVAEQGDQAAVEDFERRFPDLKPELRKRLTLVSGLRGARLASEADTPVPVFRMRSSPAPRPPSRLAWAGGALILCGLAAASYLIAKPLLTPQADKKEPVVQQSPTPPDPAVADKQAVPKSEIAIAPPQPESQPSAATDARPVVKIERAPLSLALQAIALKSHIKLEIGPGLDDPTVRLDYSDMTGMEILRDLGMKFHFTPFDQGDGTILIIPAVDPNGKRTAQANAGDDRARKIQ